MKNKLLLFAFSALISLPAFSQYQPMAISGFNNDIIANGPGNASASTTIAVDQANWDLVAPDFLPTASSVPPTASLPASGLINSLNFPGVKFQLANFTGPNGLVLTAASSSGDLNFSTNPIGDIYVLGFTGNGPTTADLVIKFTDNSTQPLTGVSFDDWYDKPGFAIQGVGRVQRLTNALEAPAGNPRLYDKKITLLAANAGKKIAGIKVTKTSATGVLNIVAVTVACQFATITAQPLNKDICPGSNTSFSISATNAATYQWQVNTGSGFANITDNSIYSGAQTATLNLTNVSMTFNNYKYQCVVTATCGNTTSAIATLTFISPVSVVPETNNYNACEGAPASISVQTAGGIQSYKWQINNTSSPNAYSDLPAQYPYTGVDTRKLDIETFMDTMAGRKFRCIVTGICSKDTSDDMMIGIIPSPHITTQPADQTIDVDHNTFFEVVGMGNNLGYYWQASWNEATPFVNISNNAFYSGVNNARLQVMQAPYPYNGVRFRCILRSFDAACDIRDTSSIAALYIRHTGIHDNERTDQVTLYPNPVIGNELFLQSSAALSAGVHIIVSDKLGRTVIDKTTNGSNNTSIPVDKLPPGMYYLRAMDKQQKILINDRFTRF